MDLANLDKMKVVDLRNELQTRGLDTKGVKAVLIERLRAHLEGGSAAGVPGSPCTPGRRSRRTRSMTKSPSPSPVKKALEPALETLEEEGNLNQPQEQEATAEKISTPEKLQEESPEGRADKQQKTPEEKQKKNLYQEKNHGSAKEAQVEEENTNGAQESQSSNKEEFNDIDKNLNVNNIQNEEEVQKRELSYGGEDDHESKAATEGHEDSPKKPSSVRGRSRSYSAEDCKSRHRSYSDSRSRSRSPHSNSNSRSRSRSRSRSTKRSRSRSPKRSRSRSPKRSRSRSPKRSRSRSPKRRSGAGSLKSPSKTKENISTPEDEPTIEENQFGLSWFDSDLHLRIDPVTFTSAKPMNHEIYALVWSGARTNYGVRDGKVCFEVRLSEETHLNRDHPFRDEPYTKGFRIGFSIPTTSLLLGESENSFAYCETGRKATNGEFVEFAKPFQLDDVIGCYLDLESTPCTIKYTLNGEELGVAFEFDKAILGEDQALFPHVLTKGYEYEINLADNDNLLVNKERKVRQRRKERKVEEKKESEKKINDDGEEANKIMKEDAKEEKKNDEGNEDENQNKAKVSEEKAADVCNKDVEETSNQDDVNLTENSEEKVKDNDEESKTEEATSTNRSEETDNKVDKHPENDETDKTVSKDQDDCGPSPSKRQKVEATEEDEFEDVHPIPREHMSLLEGYELIALIPEEKYFAGPQRPESRKNCEVILMVGLPGAGKTTWVLKHIKDNPDKRYHVIGADALIAKMTVDGVPRKSIHKGRFDRIFELCFNVLTSLEDIAVKRRRNFILDQTNAYASAQRRKMKGFGDFKRIAVVCIPNEEELKRRLVDKKEKGYAYTLKESTLNTLQAAFTLPSLEFGWFDDVIFTDLSGEEAKEEVKKYNDKGKKALDENHSNRDKRQRRDNYRNDNRRRHDDRRRHDHRNDNRWNDRRAGGGYNHGGSNRWGSGGGGGYRNNSGGYRDDRGYGGGGGGGGRGYDQRHQRYSNGPQNWVHNNRNRYDDRNNRYGGGGGGGAGNRYDSYGGGGGGGSRDYRSGGGHRDHRDRNRGNSGGVSNNRRDSHRSGGSINQRDFRHGHRDTREDSRGGSSATSATATATSSKYKTSSAADGGNGGYDKLKKDSNNQTTSTNYNSYNHQQQSQPNNWSQYQQHQATSGGQQQQQQQQQYWNYDTQGYGNQQQQWHTMDPQQQQQWMSWWQQQGNAQQTDGASAAVDPNQYWSQYSYSTSTDATKK